MFSSARSFSVKIDVSKSLCPFQGHFPGLSSCLFGMMSLPWPLLDWLLALQIQLEPHKSVHILHVLVPLESCDSEAVQLHS